ncbi:MAG: DUF805 domain-containing protein [Thermoguttaceae bacterium]|nr:DUF805 domain-containing protein [Thermoguttaceae bacterium]
MNIFCERCGKPNDFDSNFCEECGARLRKIAVAAPNVAPATAASNGPCAALDVCLRKYFVFGGRASRSEYWFAILAYSFFWAIAVSDFWSAARWAPGIVKLTIEGTIEWTNDNNCWATARYFAGLALWGAPAALGAIPIWAVSVRRLRDAGLSTAHALWPLIPSLALCVVWGVKVVLNWNSGAFSYGDGDAPFTFLSYACWGVFALGQAIFAILCAQPSKPDANQNGFRPY